MCDDWLGIVFPHLEKVRAERVWVEGDVVRVEAGTLDGALPCRRVGSVPTGSTVGIGAIWQILPWVGIRWSSTCWCDGCSAMPLIVRVGPLPSRWRA